MPTFAYVVKDKLGRTHNGSLETDSRQALIEQLWKQDFVVISVEECRTKQAMRRTSRMAVGSVHLVIFARQLATLVASGIPVLGGVDVLREQIEDRTFRSILTHVRDDIEGGSSLSESLGKYPRVFSEFFISMVRAGESAGQLDDILDRLAAYLEKTEELVRKVRASLVYPMVVTLLAMTITSGLVIFVVPKFKEIFHSLGGKLPAPTQFLLNLSDFTRHYLPAEIIALVLMITAFRFYIQTKGGQFWFHKTQLRLPVFGKLLQKVAIARFSRTLATLVRAGVPILKSLEIVAKTAGNRVVEQAVMTARTSIREGQNIANPLAQSKIFPPMVTRMIAVGEKTGELERMLTKIADFYESEVDAAVSGLTSLIEPLIIVFLGIVIGGIVIALFLPIFTISTLVNK